MNILINTESLNPPITGIGIYTLNLLIQLTQLSEIEAIDCFNGYHIASAESTMTQCLEANKNHIESSKKSQPNPARNLFRNLTTAYRIREAWRNLRLTPQTKQRQNFVYHEPNFILKNHPGPRIASIHDLSFIRYPEFHPPKRVEWLARELPKTLEAADFLITDSEVVRQELISDFSVPPSRVRAIHLGASSAYSPRSPDQTREFLTRHGLSHNKYVLFVGTFEPRKGLDTLLNAWLSLPYKCQREYPLVLAGAPGWKNKSLQARVEKLSATGSVRHLQYVASNELPLLYAGARLFVYPSIYEGFGLPVLEAMRCGTPVLCSAATSMAEFASDGAGYFQAENHSELSNLMQHLLENSAKREELAKRGLLQSKRYTWERCAKETLDVYRLAQENHGNGV
ncbi:glycosyltransferase family 4 protein [Pseudomonas sp. S5(2021)]|nr:glycosyltransferase family 4 protein [Pseudomonas sp. S5(2021)]